MSDTEAMIQARIKIAALETKVEGMGREIGELKGNIRDLIDVVGALREQMTEARGGWKTLMLLGGASATLSGAVVWVFQHLIGKAPTP